jgi:hypothetical protein
MDWNGCPNSSESASLGLEIFNGIKAAAQKPIAHGQPQPAASFQNRRFRPDTNYQLLATLLLFSFAIQGDGDPDIFSRCKSLLINH